MTQLITEMLDAEKIRAVIGAENLGFLSRLDIFDSINSTSTYLLERAKCGGDAGWVCFAEQQTKGRGRLGRVWYSPRGANIYCSLLWRFPLEQQNISTLSLAVAVIIANVLQKYDAMADVGLKWPNDVLCAKRKLAGILLESFLEKNGQVTVVIGIGINLLLSAEVNEGWIGLGEITGKMVERNYLAGLLVDELLSGLQRYQREGWAAFKDGWEARDVLRGKELTLRRAEASFSGVMQGVNEKGELRLQMPGGEILSFESGDLIYT